MRRTVSDSVAVITGASSGIARATALALAERGASVVLAARDQQSLRAAAAECERAGGHALPVPTDVTDQDAVDALAERAVAAFGRIDVWVNSAAVIAFGEFEKTPPEVYRRVIETNLFGQIHGARAVLPHFRRQGTGVLINVGSVWGSVTSPYVSAYVTSKFGVRAFSESLQEALRLERETRGIHVCTILPQAVDTPIFQHAATYTDQRPKAISPIVGPARVVRAIVRSIEHPRRQRTVAGTGRLLEFGHAVSPSFFSRVVPTAMKPAGVQPRAGEYHARKPFRAHGPVEPGGRPVAAHPRPPRPGCGCRHRRGRRRHRHGQTRRAAAKPGPVITTSAVLGWAPKSDPRVPHCLRQEGPRDGMNGTLLAPDASWGATGLQVLQMSHEEASRMPSLRGAKNA